MDRILIDVDQDYARRIDRVGQCWWLAINVRLKIAVLSLWS